MITRRTSVRLASQLWSRLSSRRSSPCSRRYLDLALARLRAEVERAIAEIRTDLKRETEQRRVDLERQIAQLRIDTERMLRAQTSKLVAWTAVIVGLAVTLVGRPGVLS